MEEYNFNFLLENRTTETGLLLKINKILEHDIFQSLLNEEIGEGITCERVLQKPLIQFIQRSMPSPVLADNSIIVAFGLIFKIFCLASSRLKSR